MMSTSSRTTMTLSRTHLPSFPKMTYSMHQVQYSWTFDSKCIVHFKFLVFWYIVSYRCFVAGTQFHYTTHGWTLLSAVIERVSGQPFLDSLRLNILSPLGMDSTGPEQQNSLAYHRAR